MRTGAIVLGALLLTACSGGDASSSEEAYSGPSLRFDVATILETSGDGAYANFNDTDKDHCAPIVVPTIVNGTKHFKCLREAEWSALNYASHHFIAMPTDSHRSKIQAAGNDLAAYVDKLNDGYHNGGSAEGIAAAEGVWADMQTSYGGSVPAWIILNEISSAWTSSQPYRDYVVAVAQRLTSAHGRKVIVASQFPTVSMQHASDWAKLGNAAWIGVEVQVTGSDVAGNGNAALDAFGAAMTSYTNTGIAKSKVMLVDNYSNTPGGWAFGRDGVSADEWRAAIKKRVSAAGKVGFAGYITYAWEGNNAQSPSDVRQSFVSAYSGFSANNGGNSGGGNQPPPPPPQQGGTGALQSGQSIAQPGSVKSLDGRFNLVLQNDGNLVLYFEGHGALWATSTSGAGHKLAMQGDGNLVLYDAASKPAWASNTQNHPGATLAVQNDGNLVVYAGSTPLWASNTCCH